MTVHDDIDNLLAANLHGELNDAERAELQNHLLDCPACRQAHQETKIMNELLEEKLAKPDAAFEHRILANFRERVPGNRRSLPQLMVDLLRLRSAQIAAVAAVLLALIQVGRFVSGEKSNGQWRYGVLEQSGAREMALAQPSATVKPIDSLEAQLKDGLAGRNLMRNPSTTLAKKPLSPPPPAPVPTEFKEKNVSSEVAAQARAERAIVSDGNVPTAEENGPNPTLNLNRDAIEGAGNRNEENVSTPNETPNPALANRKLIRNATVELEIASFEDAVQKITRFANEARGYVATSSSEKQANGKLKGEVVVKVLPENLDGFLQRIRGLGELKNQTLGTEDVTKQYFDTDARLKNAHVMEQRLIDMLKTKTGKVSDLLQVEKELARVREDIEKMQGELKFWDSQVQFATITISLAEKDLEEPAAFLLKESAQLSLYAADVEKIYNDIKAFASPKVQITNAQLDRDNSGRVSARLSMLIVPEESDGVIGKTKSLGRVGNFQTQTERIAQGGNGLSENAKTKRDKVELNISITREIEEQPVQETSLRILTSNVDQNAARLKDQATKSGAEVRNSTFTRDPDGREVANISLRVTMKDYPALMKSFNQLGQVKDVSVQRRDRTDKNAAEETAPADVSIVIYSQGNIVSDDTGLVATVRHTIAQSAGAIMWSIRMIGVAIAFLAPWAIAIVAVVWIAKRLKRARSSKS